MTAPVPVPDGTTPPAEAVEAVMEASDCSRAVDRNGSAYCEAHWVGWLSDVNACARAERIAAAVVAALNLPERDRETAAKAWGEGHTTRWRRDPDDGCTCGAWASIECGCGRYGSGELLSLNDNPYRASALRERRES